MTDAETPALSLVDLGKRYGGLHAVDGLTFAVPPASIFGVMGPNEAPQGQVLNLISGSFEVPTTVASGSLRNVGERQVGTRRRSNWCFADLARTFGSFLP